ncbi:MAG: hypothetical protein AAB380_06285, partial [Verrucomicrobiota bacterium]
MKTSNFVFPTMNMFNSTPPSKLAAGMPPSPARKDACRHVEAAILGCRLTRLPSRVFQEVWSYFKEMLGMKPKVIATLFLGSVLFASTLLASATAADLSQLTADVAKWESGQSPEPLRKFEQLARASAGKRAERAELEAALIKLLGPNSTFEARRFACQQLAVIGSDASVSAIAKLLAENETIGIACLAFGNRPSAKADQALRAALPAARGQGRLQIISTLGNRRDA